MIKKSNTCLNIVVENREHEKCNERIDDLASIEVGGTRIKRESGKQKRIEDGSSL
jgi:hypothetical protein